MSWLGFAPTALVAVALTFLPGLLVARLLRLRGVAWLAVSAPLSISLIAVSALAAGAVGVPWSAIPVAILTGVAAVAAWAWSRWIGRPVTTVPRGSNAADRLTTLVALAVPAIAIGVLLARAMHDPEFFSQRYDNFFHLNAVRYVLDTGNASPLWLGTMTSPDGTLPFYPSAWHATVSLIVQLSGASVIAATNATIFAVAALVWPLGAIFLVRTLLGSGRVATVAAGVFAAAFPAFPYLPLHYGVLYPLFLGLACAPAALAVCWFITRPGHVARRQDWVLLLVLLIPGVGVAHPGALLAVVALSAPMVIAGLLCRALGASRVQRGRVVILLAAYVIAGIVLLLVVRPPADQIYWPTIESIPQAVGSVVTAAVYGYPAAWLPAVFIAIGAYSVLRRPSYARVVVLAAAVIGSVLYIVVSASSSETLRNFLTGPWYNNPPRLASIWVLGVVPLAALGVDHAVRWLMRVRSFARPRNWVRRHAVVSSAILALLLVFGAQGAALRQASADINYTYEVRADAPIVSPDELALMLELDRLVPADAVIAGDPYTGSSFAYALSGRRVLMPHLLMNVSDDMRLISEDFATEGSDPRMCQALADTGARYILDFSADGDFMENDADFDGLAGLSASPYVALVAQEGDARLYAVTSCGLRQ